jgi:hypothetical protein
MRRFAPVFLLLTTSATQSATTNQVEWHWERDTPTCAQNQAYSSDGNVIKLSRTPGNDQSLVFIGGMDAMPANSKSLLGGRVKFLPGGESDAEIFVTKAKGRRDISALSDDPAFLSKFARASAVEITQKELGTTRVPLRSAAAAVEAIRTCEDTRMRQWGIDPVAWRALKARPLPLKSWSEWIGPDDYPITALLEGSQGYMILRFEIRADGHVRDCRPLVRGRPVQSRVRICSRLKGVARFKPAIASSGETVAAPYVLIISFRLV